MTCQGAQRAIEIIGLPEMPIERITLENVEIAAQHGALLREANEVTLRDVRLQTVVERQMRWRRRVGGSRRSE